MSQMFKRFLLKPCLQLTFTVSKLIIADLNIQDVLKTCLKQKKREIIPFRENQQLPMFHKSLVIAFLLSLYRVGICSTASSYLWIKVLKTTLNLIPSSSNHKISSDSLTSYQYSLKNQYHFIYHITWIFLQENSDILNGRIFYDFCLKNEIIIIIKGTQMQMVYIEYPTKEFPVLNIFQLTSRIQQNHLLSLRNHNSGERLKDTSYTSLTTRK